MLDAVVANFLDTVEEREFDAPFMAYLRSAGFYDIHFTHGSYEFGKDFIAKRCQDGVIRQYAFQSKAGDLNLADWNNVQGQLEMLRENRLVHPSFDLALQRRAVFLTTGRLVGGAILAAKDYCQRLVDRGDVPLEIWDRERLVELLCSAVAAGLADRIQGPLLGTLAAIEDRTISDFSLEKFSQRWCRHEQNPPACVLEAAIVAAQLHATARADLACYVGLALVRAACSQMHGSNPPDDSWVSAANLGRRLFVTYADPLWRVAPEGGFSASVLLSAHGEAGALITHAVRCVRLAELIGLLGLMDRLEGYNSPSTEEIGTWLSAFLTRQKAAASPISDRWAVAIIPAVLLLAKAGLLERAADQLRDVLIWLAQRYGKGVGLAGASASVDQELQQVIGNAIPSGAVERRSESYLATVLLDLTAFLKLDSLYRLVYNEIQVVGAQPCVLASEDSSDQYMFEGRDLSYELNAQYADAVTGDWRTVAPHLARAVAPRYLQSIDRSWDHLAVSAVLRDRHFVSAWRSFVTDDSKPAAD